MKFVDGLPSWLILPVLTLSSWLGGRKARRFVLVIEDLGKYRVGDQVSGCSMAEAENALDTMATLHAQFWNSPELDSKYPWIMPIDVGANVMQTMFRNSLPKFIEANKAWLTARNLEHLHWLNDHGVELVAESSKLPFTLLHGDFRLDNLCFDDEKEEVILFDWQTLSKGPAGLELAYFLSASLDTDMTQDDEKALLQHYQKRLGEAGIDISFEQIEREYEIGMALLLLRTAPAKFQNLMEIEGGRGDDLLDTWMERVMHKLENIDPETLLSANPG